MTVKELIEQLGRMNPEAEVHIQYNYGDHWRTQVTPAAKEARTREVTFSAYHDMDRLCLDSDFDDNGILKGKVHDFRQVVVIR